ncbi:MAG: hypothetical protein ACKO57_03435, partial [Alphaproteobacteria bacterium]
DLPAEEWITILGIGTANGISTYRSWTLEKRNIMACVANVMSIIGYSAVNTNLGLALITLGTACRSLGQTGFKGTRQND